MVPLTSEAHVRGSWTVWLLGAWTERRFRARLSPASGGLELCWRSESDAHWSSARLRRPLPGPPGGPQELQAMREALTEIFSAEFGELRWVEPESVVLN